MATATATALGQKFLDGAMVLKDGGLDADLVLITPACFEGGAPPRMQP